MESAIADIQLFGSSRQAALAFEFAQSCAGAEPASALDLLRELRADLRHELGLEQLELGPLQLRFDEPSDRKQT